MLRIDDRLAPTWEASIDPSNMAQPPPDDFWSRALAAISSRTDDIGNEEELRSFLLSMIALDPNNRLSAEALLSHPYLIDVPFCAEISGQTKLC